MRRFRPVQRVDGDDTDRARHAGTDLAVVVLLLVAEEHVAMIDLALDGNDIDGADTAFAALAVRYHLEAGGVSVSASNCSGTTSSVPVSFSRTRNSAVGFRPLEPKVS